MISFEKTLEEPVSTIAGTAFREKLFVLNNGSRTYLTCMTRFETTNDSGSDEFDYHEARIVIHSYLASNGQSWSYEDGPSPNELLEELRWNSVDFGQGDMDDIHVFYDEGDTIKVLGYIQSINAQISYSFINEAAYLEWASEAKLIDSNVSFEIIDFNAPRPSQHTLDFFKYYEHLPIEVQQVVFYYGAIIEDGCDDVDSVVLKFLVDIKTLGFSFYIDADGLPTNLTKLAINSN